MQRFYPQFANVPPLPATDHKSAHRLVCIRRHAGRSPELAGGVAVEPLESTDMCLRPCVPVPLCVCICFCVFVSSHILGGAAKFPIRLPPPERA